MAGALKNMKISNKHVSHDVFFDGALLSTTRGLLVIELIKYFLYERQQIPMTVDELKLKVAQDEEIASSVCICHWDMDKQVNSGVFRADVNTPQCKIAEFNQSQILGSDMDTISCSVPFADLNNLRIKMKSSSSSLNSLSDCPSSHSSRSSSNSIPTTTTATVINPSAHTQFNLCLNYGDHEHFLIAKAKPKLKPGNNNGFVESTVPQCRAHRARLQANDKNAKLLVSQLTQLFDSLQKAFESCPEIEQVAIVLGGTVMNPKESYLISFPPPCPEADSLPYLSCKQVLFQRIISEDMLSTVSTNISPTSMIVLISAPRSCPLKGFVPKHVMRTPKTGTVVSFNLQSNYQWPISYDLTVVDEDCELSGLEIFDKHHKNGALLCNGIHSFKNEDLAKEVQEWSACRQDGIIVNSDCESGYHSSGGNLGPSCSDSLSDPRCALDHHDRKFGVSEGRGLVNNSPTAARSPHIHSDCIWYQSLFVIKGYKNQDVGRSCFLSS